MATVAHENATPREFDPGRVQVIRWTPLTTANADGEWIVLPGLPDKTVHVYGTFGVGATVAIEGSNETGTPAAGAQVNDSRGEGNPLTFLTAGGNDIKQMNENPFKVRPVLTGGDGTTSLTVAIVCKG